MDRIRVDGANGIRFSTRKIFSSGSGISPFNGAFTTSNTASASDSMSRIPKTDINPNKAVFTIDSKSSNILIVNNKACQLLDYRPSELCDMKFSSLLTNKTNKSYVSALAEGQLNSEDGTMVLLSGKVVEMTTKSGLKVAVSLWIRQIDADGRCLAVAEPVERRIAQIVVDKNGKILSADNETLMLFQIDVEDELFGSDIKNLIPAIQLPNADNSPSHSNKTMYKQKATGKTKDNLSFPLCLMITPQNDAGVGAGAGVGAAGSAATSSAVETTGSSELSVDSTNSYVITIWVFQNISGLVVIDENGSIDICNHHFSMLMFGYAQSKIIRLHITNLIPDFAQELEYLGIGEWHYNSRSRNITFSSLDNESETETDPVYYEAESFYATPAASDRSKSINENDNSIYEMSSTVQPHQIKTLDMSKAISEPIQIYLNSLIADSVQSYVVDATKIADIEKDELRKSLDSDTAKACTVGKSFSDNTLAQTDSSLNIKATKRYHCQLKNFEVNEIKQTANRVILVQNQAKTSDKEDETSNCDANELLTPVNESNVSESYLLESETSESVKVHCRNDLSDALKELDIDISSTELPSQAREKSHHSSSKREKKNQVLSSQSALKSSSRRFSTQQNLFPDGKYKGKAIHCDGNVFNILYTISSQELPCGRKVFCVWICRDECDLDDEEEDDGKHPNLTLTFNSITSNIETSVDCGGPTGTVNKRNSMNVNANQSSRPNSVSLLSQYEDEQVSGEYNKYYTSLKQIGKGAFGYVKLSFRHSDRLLVVTKFILKDKLPPQFMVIDDKKEIPMEVYLLSTLKHPNIVTVLDVFENDKFFQLVMEKHGSGMDLFEFIDRRPLIDEQLGSYIFRQIVNAIDYLHSLKILHRDIKDENIIIDQHFHVKLIDFGSATFMEDGKLFSTFYGTTEYCSPEVLAGNKYAGPELEIWALGITLFVLIFFENPFIDIEETLHSELHLPHTVSPALEKTLTSMLDKSPKTRYTMKQLISDPWVTQELGPCNFNFSWIVPCENHESNPEKYFTGQIYSSATGFSTTSPTCDEEDSIIDDDIEDEELCEEQLNQEFDYRKCRKSNEIFESKDNIVEPIMDTSSNADQPTMANATIINTTTNTGKALQLPIATPKNIPSLVTTNTITITTTNNCKRNVMAHGHQQFDSKKPTNKCKCKCNCSSIAQNKRSANNERIILNANSCDLNHCIQKESFSCDSISKSCFVPLADLYNETDDDDDDDALRPKPIRSPKPLSSSSLLGYTSINPNISAGNTTTTLTSLSKSETNIAETNIEDNRNQLSIYNVVSLNNLHDTEPFFNRTLNDLAKNQCLTDSDENNLYELNPKTLTSPKVLTTVSMRNAADVSDKVF